MTLPSLSRLGLLVPTLKLVMRVSLRVDRVSGSAPRLPTRRTVLVMSCLRSVAGTVPDRLKPRNGERSGSPAPRSARDEATPKQGWRGQPRRGNTGRSGAGCGLTPRAIGLTKSIGRPRRAHPRRSSHPDLEGAARRDPLG